MKKVDSMSGDTIDTDHKTSGASEPDTNQEVEAPIDLAQVIGLGIASIMRNKTEHKYAEQKLDEWFRQLPSDKDKRINMVKESRKQMETARQAMELLYSRFRSAESTAKS